MKTLATFQDISQKAPRIGEAVRVESSIGPKGYFVRASRTGGVFNKGYVVLIIPNIIEGIDRTTYQLTGNSTTLRDSDTVTAICCIESRLPSSTLKKYNQIIAGRSLE